MTKTVLITGVSGFIGSHLAFQFIKKDYQVIGLTRNSRKVVNPSVRVITNLNQIDSTKKIDVVINLAGAPINKRWTSSYKKTLIKSRVASTQYLVQWMKSHSNKPDLFISASATGYYGSTGSEIITEKSDFQPGFTHSLCQMWENEAIKAEALNIRTCIARFGVVLGETGGALEILIPSFMKGLGGKIGTGRQYFSWIHLDDVSASIEYMIENKDCRGVYNLTAPNPITNAELTRALSDIFQKPAFLTIPSFIIKLLFGEMGKKLVLEGQNVIPARLKRAGYRFKYSNIESALKNILY